MENKRRTIIDLTLNQLGINKAWHPLVRGTVRRLRLVQHHVVVLNSTTYTTKGPAVPPELSTHQPPAILGKSGRSYHPQGAKGARREPVRYPRRAIWIPEDTINGTPSPEDDRVHHGRAHQERSDRSLLLDVSKAFHRVWHRELLTRCWMLTFRSAW